MLKVVRSKRKRPSSKLLMRSFWPLSEPGFTKHMGSRAWFPVWLCPWPGGAGAGQRFAAGLLWLWAGPVWRACPVGSCLGSTLSQQQRSWLGSSWSSSRAQELCCLCQQLCPIWGDGGLPPPETTTGVPHFHRLLASFVAISEVTSGPVLWSWWFWWAVGLPALVWGGWHWQHCLECCLLYMWLIFCSFSSSPLPPALQF